MAGHEYEERLRVIEEAGPRDRRDRYRMSPLELLSLVIYGKLAKRIVKRLELDKKLLMKNSVVHPIRLVSRVLFNATLAYIVLLPFISLIVEIVPYPYDAIMIASILFLPALYVLLTLSIASDTSGVKERINKEMIFFVFHLSVLAKSRAPILEIFRKLSTSTVYRTISGYILRAYVYSRLMAQELLSSLEEVSNYVPVHTLRIILTGFASTMRTKGSVEDFVERAMGIALEEYNNYVEKVKGSLRMYGTIYILLAIAMVVFNVVEMSTSLISAVIPMSIYIVLSLGIVPFTVLVIIIMSYGLLPLRMKESKLPLLIALALAPSSLAAYSLTRLLAPGLGVSVALAIAALVPVIGGAVVASRMSSEWEKLLEDLERFLSDLASGRRLGLPLEQVILGMEENYGSLNRALRRLKVAIKTGIPMEQAVEIAFADIEQPAILFLVGLIGDSLKYGSTDAESISFMRRIVKELLDAMNEMKKALKSAATTPYAAIATQLVAEVVMLSTAGLFASQPFLQTSFTGGGSVAGISAPFINMSNMERLMKSVVFILDISLVLQSLLAGFLISVLRNQSLMKGFMHSAILLTFFILLKLVATFIL